MRALGALVQGIGVYIEYHVGSATSYFCIGVRGHVVVKELVYVVACVFIRSSLLANDSR
jgi:hypothetical protein